MLLGKPFTTLEYITSFRKNRSGAIFIFAAFTTLFVLMEKFFSLNKLFVFFCAGLIIIWASLQLVSYFHLVDLAKLQGQLILSWSWPSKNIRSKAEVYKTQVITKSSTDAVVEVKAKQFLQTCQSPGAPYKDSGVISESQAKLTYYKTNNRWILGVVELQ